MDYLLSLIHIERCIRDRVNALLRRSGLTAGNDEKFVEAGGIKLDKTAHLVTVYGRPIELSIKEFELLDYFMENQGIALSREKILNNVWNYDYFGDARTCLLYTSICSLAEQRLKIIYRADSSTHGKRDKYLFCDLPHHIDHSLPRIRRCCDV